VKLTRFLADAHKKGGTSVADELDPLGLILSRIGVNRSSVESQALLRVRLAAGGGG